LQQKPKTKDYINEINNKKGVISMIFEYDDYSDDELMSLKDQDKKINSLEDASRYAYGVSVTKEKIEEIESIANKEIERWKAKIKEVEDWRDNQVTKLNDSKKYLEYLLTDYHKRVFESASEKEQKKLKSIKLPYGVTLSSKVKTDLKVNDNDKYVSYCMSNGFFEEVPPKLKWGQLKNTLEVVNGNVVNCDGEILDFIDAKIERGFDVNE
jgi:hypothetical protein